jgi:hypothetical protein
MTIKYSIGMDLEGGGHSTLRYRPANAYSSQRVGTPVWIWSVLPWNKHLSLTATVACPVIQVFFMMFTTNVSTFCSTASEKQPI